MKRLLLSVFTLASLPVFAQKQKLVTDPVEKYAQTITTVGLKEKLTVIASAEMQGREDL